MLNETSYAYHYRNIDSTKVFAQRALQQTNGYDAGRAEAYNNLAFVEIIKMQFGGANDLLQKIEHITDNQIELLIADIQQMRLCQRESRNKDFYNYREKAMRRLKRIEEEKSTLSDHEMRRLIYARSEFYIVTSTYYYYVGLEQPSINALRQIDPNGEIQKDTAQTLAYYYCIGSGGMIPNGSQEEINQAEFNYLFQCYIEAGQGNYPYWIANSLQALSEHLQIAKYRDKLINDNYQAIQFVNADAMPDSLIAGNFAQRSLDIFEQYGDIYQTAGAYRTLAECYWQINDYPSALICLQNALNKDTLINQAPDLVASIREQLSLVYSAVDDKPNSDFNRNAYLDLQEQTRQDRYLESRAEQLNSTSDYLNLLIWGVIVAIVLTVALFVLFDHLRRKNDRKFSIRSLLLPLQEWQKRNECLQQEQADEYEEIKEEQAICERHVADNKRRNLEQRAKLSLVLSITPFIDRIINETLRLQHIQNIKDKEQKYTYIAELADQIDRYNSVLTQWIQMRQGELSLHIESFPLQDLFDVVNRSQMSFKLKGVNLIVKPTQEVVKADKTLTLFMINTIADNARKFTSEGDVVDISAKSTDTYVEISVKDTGRGIEEHDLKEILTKKVYNGHGFGLMNCRGIMDKYKKISKIFNVCTLSAESRPGKGSRFFFRLPKGIARWIFIPVMLLSSMSSFAGINYAAKAEAFADSAYYSNINGTYALTLNYADSCRYYLNALYRAKNPKGDIFLKKLDAVSALPPEVEWLHKGFNINYQVVLNMRNESAVAALALHEWQVYRYNNKVYTLMFKELSADNTLSDYCRMMQKSEQNKNVAIIILLMLLVAIFPAYYFIYYRHRIYYRYCVEQVKNINEILLTDMPAQEKLDKIKLIGGNTFPVQLSRIVEQITSALEGAIHVQADSSRNIDIAKDELRKIKYEDDKLHISNSVLDNCLSTLKHETMFYPSRIRQLVDGKDDNLESIAELAAYYKEIYSILSLQGIRQVENMPFECKRINLAELLPDIPGNINVLGDKDNIRTLFALLKRQYSNKPLAFSAFAKNDDYVIVSLTVEQLQLSEDQCRDIFYPSVEHIPLLICRQIVRENGETTHHRGCGIVVEPKDNATVFKITLTKAK